MATDNTLDGDIAIMNYIDIKLHHVHNLPPSWCSEGKSPMAFEHPFRYEVAFSLDEVNTNTFTLGRPVRYLPQYANYIENASLPPPQTDAGDILRKVREVPPSPRSSSINSKAMQSNSSKVLPESAQTDTRIVWVMTPSLEAAAAPPDEPGAKRRKKNPLASSVCDVLHPSLPSEDDPPPCIIRLPLDERLVGVLETMILTGKPLELRFSRVLKAGLPSDWEDKHEWYFRATIPISLAPLAEPGSVCMKAEVQLIPVKDPARNEDVKKKSSKRGRTGPQGLLLEDIDTEAEHPYVTCNTTATVSISVNKTLARLPSDRIHPGVLPSSLIPKRAPPREQFQDGTQQFMDLVASIAKKMVSDYMAAAAENDENVEEKIMENFQTSGQLAAYKEQLTPVVVKIARENFLPDKEATPDVIARLTNELYVHLLDCVHTTLLNMATKSKKDVETAARLTEGAADGKTPVAAHQPSVRKPDAVVSQMWLERAEEAETLHEYAHATRCHQARIASCTATEEFADICNDAAAFFVRIGETTRAEQCFREAVAHDPTHAPSLLGYGALLLTFDRFEEAAVFLHAAVDAKPSTLTWGFIVLLCDMHILTLEKGPKYDLTRARWDREGTLAMKEAIDSSMGMDSNAVCLLIAEHMLDLRHLNLANVALSRCRSGGKADLLYARLFALGDQYNDALEALQDEEGLKQYADQAAILRGDCFVGLGRNEEAIVAYKGVLCRDGVKPQRRFGASYVHLGNLLITAGRYHSALAVFTLGIEAWPCSLMWLGAGIACYRLDKVDEAEECLSESNTLNNTNPRTWAYLSLVCLRKERVEMEAVLRQAITQGLRDAALLTELGRDLARASMDKLGEGCLRKALAVEQEAGRSDSEVCCLASFYLAGVLESQFPDESQQLYTAVISHCKDEVLRGRAEEQLALLNR
ncbi:putative Tetratricopeptide repeat [Trypanosoma vivax]|uniref:Tetratricopeptide repeat protein n=1 Tax=Trypanosoma vivax (strain Y486) TaxID=1055687 RepID=G0U5N8_TRYVY|nr:putative Tetratricopeptide repeat [Trypanosoma vivax]CCC51189.1 conserved hypothetical protein [Trypanosoma vivax Y486]